MLDPNTLIIRITEMHQALATLPVSGLDKAITAALRYNDTQISTPRIKVLSNAEFVGVALSALAHCSYYSSRTFCYPVLVILRALHEKAQQQNKQWASELTPWQESFPADMLPELIPYYSQMSLCGLIGLIATETREEDDEFIEWLHRSLMHICIFCYLRGIDLISDIRTAYQ